MHKFIIIITLLFHPILQAGGEALPSVCVEKTEEQTGGWPQFLVKSGNQVFLSRFPAHPTLQYEGDKANLFSVDTSSFPAAIYGISFLREPGHSIDPEVLFEDILANYSTYPNVLLSNKTSIDGDTYYLELTTRHIRYEIYRRELVIVMPYNIFHLYSITPLLAPDNFGYFLHSFDFLENVDAAAE